MTVAAATELLEDERDGARRGDQGRAGQGPSDKFVEAHLRRITPINPR